MPPTPAPAPPWHMMQYVLSPSLSASASVSGDMATGDEHEGDEQLDERGTELSLSRTGDGLALAPPAASWREGEAATDE